MVGVEVAVVPTNAPCEPRERAAMAPGEPSEDLVSAPGEPREGARKSTRDSTGSAPGAPRD